MHVASILTYILLIAEISYFIKLTNILITLLLAMSPFMSFDRINTPPFTQIHNIIAKMYFTYWRILYQCEGTVYSIYEEIVDVAINLPAFLSEGTGEA